MLPKAPPVPAYLNFNLPNGTQHQVALDRPAFICRAPLLAGLQPVRAIYFPPATSVFLENARLSPRHAELSFDEGSWAIRDLGSENGTFLNGERLGSAGRPLSHGDRISFANVPSVFGQTYDPLNTALLVGNPSSDLKGVENDLESVGLALSERKQFSGRIRAVCGPRARKERVQAELSYLSRYASGSSLSIFYYSGHGGPGGLQLRDGSLSPGELFSCLQAFPGKKLVLLDCCHAGGFLLGPPPDTLVLTGESPDKSLYEGKVSMLMQPGAVWIQGYLTRAFVKLLEGNPLQMELGQIAGMMERYCAAKVEGVKVFAAGSAMQIRSAMGLKPVT